MHGNFAFSLYPKWLKVHLVVYFLFYDKTRSVWLRVLQTAIAGQVKLLIPQDY